MLSAAKHPLHGEETLRHKTAQGDKPIRLSCWAQRSIPCTARRPFATKRLRVTNLTKWLPEQGFSRENDTKVEQSQNF